MKRIHAFHPPRPCRHEIVPATVTHPGVGFGPTLCHHADLNTGHLFIGPDAQHLTRVAPENIIWPGKPPAILSKTKDKKDLKPKKPSKKETEKQIRLAEMRDFIMKHL
jgi:hypothetical protein